MAHLFCRFTSPLCERAVPTISILDRRRGHVQSAAGTCPPSRLRLPRSTSYDIAMLARSSARPKRNMRDICLMSSWDQAGS